MPELPEVETTRRGIAPYLLDGTVTAVEVRERRLRWPVSDEIETLLPGQRILGIERRGKYLLFNTAAGTLMLHLGMSGSLRIVSPEEAPKKHDHVDIIMKNGVILRFHDPRKFGSLLWAGTDPASHALLKNLGPEPLGDAFSADYLFQRSRGRKAPVKTFIMDAAVVVGVGNIYANEALFLAGISPRRAAGRVSRVQYETLWNAIRQVLAAAIEQGGTTLRDFVGGDGRPGYFRQQLAVYGRGGEPCRACANTLKEIRLGQRSTVYCTKCQL